MKLPVKSMSGFPRLNGNIAKKGAIITPETTVEVDGNSSIFFGNEKRFNI